MLNQEKYLIAADGKKLSIRRLGKGHKEAVVIVPGYNQSKNAKIFQKMALDFVEDFDCISIDMRGQGNSEGLCTFGSKETADLKILFDYAHRFYKTVHVIAFSMGAFTTVNEVARFNNVSDIVLVSSPMNFKDIEGCFWKPGAVRVGIHSIKEGDASFTFGNPFLKKEIPIDTIANVKVPILFMHGTRDPIVDIRHSQTLYKIANFPKKLIVFENGNHAEELYRQFPEEFMKIAKEFFKEGDGDGKDNREGGSSNRLYEAVGYIK